MTKFPSKHVKMCFDDFYKMKTKFAHEKHMVVFSYANMQVCTNVLMQMCKDTCIPYGPNPYSIFPLHQIFKFDSYTDYSRCNQYNY